MKQKPLIFAVLLFLVGIAGLYFFRHSLVGRAHYESCYAKLRHIHGAKDWWSQEFGTNGSPTIDDLLKVGGLKPSSARCPEGGTYTVGTFQENPTCSLPGHGLGFGKVVVLDVAGKPLSNVPVTLSLPAKPVRTESTDTAGIATLTRFPASESGTWQDARISVHFNDSTQTVSSPRSWPVRIQRAHD